MLPMLPEYADDGSRHRSRNQDHQYYRWNIHRLVNIIVGIFIGSSILLSAYSKNDKRYSVGNGCADPCDCRLPEHQADG
ncbi:MAG: hypothetical protein SPL26_03975, partial [Bacteroidales bacterium]|nr:hypothetical protein [Bacteroidales bacterium]